MNPITLKAENFLSYSKVDLDLSSVSLAAIVGENGAGKSSLLDMLTWGLYGNGRYPLIDDYIRQGAQQATLETVFELGGETYRVVRTRSNKGRGKTTLEFAKKEGAGWKPLSGTIVSETQQRIIDTIRLDYNTFVSTCFILQKQSDKLTSATPGERKQVFAKALGLDYYDKLLEMAKAKAKERKERLARYEMEMALLESKTRDKEELEQEQRQCKLALSGLQKEQKELQERIHELEKERDDCQKQLNEKDYLLERKQGLNKRSEEIYAFKSEIKDLQILIEDSKGLDAELADKEKQKAIANEKVEEWSARLTELRVMAGKIPDMEAAIKKAKDRESELLQTGAEITKKLDRYKKILANADIVKEKAQMHDQLKKELDELNQKQAKHRMLKGKAEEWERKACDFDKEKESAITHIEALIAKAQKQVSLLDKVPCGEDMQIKCPLLQSAIDAKAEIGRLTNSKTAWEIRVNPYLGDWQQAKKERDAVGYDEGHHTDVAMQITELEPFAKLLPELEHAEESVKDLEAQKQANGDKTIITSKEISNLGKDLEKAQQAQEKAKGYVAMIDEGKQRVQATENAIKSIQEKRVRLEAHKEQLEKMEKDLPAKEQEQLRIALDIEGIERALEGFTEIEASKVAKEMAIKDRQAEWDAVMEKIGHTQSQMGKIEARLDDVQKAEAEKADKDAQIKVDAHEVYLYETLVKAFGKNGIPALIIENALPEIELIANDLLGSLTDGRMRLELITQKETKTAGMSETLDIIISDELGQRPYEGWSGAESYEVDIALRVAVSKFLAKRAGASVKTLVIDEGLGSLDADGKRKFIEAVNTLAADFDKVLCISHIDEIKEAFPQQITVRKTPSGSIAEVV